MSGSDLYAGGDFTTAGGSAANYIAKWNGSSWSALGFGDERRRVYALAVSGSDLYAGGYFTTAGGSRGQLHRQMEREHLVGPGLGDGHYAVRLRRWRCRAATCMRGASSRRRAAARPTNIAKWNGSTWSALGSGMDTDYCVYALAVSGSDLYAGGDFTTAGGSAAN